MKLPYDTYIYIYIYIYKYVNIVWEPHQQYLIDNIEMVQRRAAIGGSSRIIDKPVALQI